MNKANKAAAPVLGCSREGLRGPVWRRSRWRWGCGGPPPSLSAGQLVQHRLETGGELGPVVGGEVAAVGGAQRVGEVRQGRQPVDQVVGHRQELELVGGGGEGGAHDEVHLHRRQHRPQGVQLGGQIIVEVPKLQRIKITYTSSNLSIGQTISIFFFRSLG